MASKQLSTPRNDARLILSGAGAITLFFFTSLRDPFNQPKLWMTILVGAWLAGHLISDLLLKKFTEGQVVVKRFSWIVAGFVTLLLIAALHTNYKYTAFFGDSQRNTGFLAYFFLAMFALSAAKHIKFKNISYVYIAGISVGALMTLYGVLQHFGHDFVKWNNPYNSIISTVGNPDFAAGIMAVFLVLAFASIFATNWKLWIKGGSAVIATLILLVIYWSQARQGLLSFGVAGGLFLVIWIWQKNKYLGMVGAGGYLVVFALGLLGIFKIGPLAGSLYKSSVSIRGFYWRAGLEMLKTHPWFGVGVDRYGSYFRQYREAQYPLNYGYDITSTAAHNVIIEIFATCGVFVGIAYLGILGFVVYRGIVGIRNAQGKARLLIAGVFCAWIAYEAQSIVSIDNLGIAIWGWVLAGAVVGVSLKEIAPIAAPEERGHKVRTVQRQSSVAIAAPIISAVVSLAMLFVVVTQYRGESQMYNVNRYAIPKTQSDRNYYHQIIATVNSIPWMNPMYTLQIGSNLAQAGFVDEGFATIEKVIKEDPQSYAGLGLEAGFYEQLHKFDKAAPLRERMALLDPWGAQNLLTLGQDYLQLGQKDKALALGKRIVAMAPLTQQAKDAKAQLGA
jgi:O-antigen ligase